MAGKKDPGIREQMLEKAPLHLLGMQNQWLCTKEGQMLHRLINLSSLLVSIREHQRMDGNANAGTPESYHNR